MEAKMTQEERLEEQQSEALDAEKMADEIHGTIRKSELLRDERVLRQFSDELRDALNGATSCETQADFDANIKTAAETIPFLTEALKAVKKAARKEKDNVALECIEEALSELRALASEVSDLSEESASDD